MMAARDGAEAVAVTEEILTTNGHGWTRTEMDAGGRASLQDAYFLERFVHKKNLSLNK